MMLKISPKISLPKIINSLILFALLLSACSIRQYVPQASKGISIEDNFAVFRTDSLLVAIRPQAWVGEPTNLNANFFCVFLQVRNSGKIARSLIPGDIGIITMGVQYDPIPAQSIIQAYYHIRSIEMNQFDPFFNKDKQVQNRDMNENWPALILQNSFGFGSILPGAMKRGFVFFPREAGQDRELIVSVLGTELHFMK